jgi:hypothetical protein
VVVGMYPEWWLRDFLISLHLRRKWMLLKAHNGRRSRKESFVKVLFFAPEPDSLISLVKQGASHVSGLDRQG